MKVNFYWNKNTGPAFVVGSLVIMKNILNLFLGYTKSTFYYYTGRALIVDAILNITISIILMSRVFYIKKDRDFNTLEYVLFAIALMACMFVPKILFG
jgi:hypothetical protein